MNWNDFLFNHYRFIKEWEEEQKFKNEHSRTDKQDTDRRTESKTQEVR